MKAKPFEDKYVPVPETGCWLWTSAWAVNGYGQATDNVKAHRLSWELHRGPIPPGMFVCHKCDTPPCVNPDHLFLGTMQDNVADMMAKGRNFAGELHHSAKLTHQDVLAVRVSSDTNEALAEQYRVHPDTIRRARTGRGWRKLKSERIVPPPKMPASRGEACGAAKLTAEQAREIKQRLASGGTVADIVRDFPVAKSAVYKIKLGQSWAHVA